MASGNHMGAEARNPVALRPEVVRAERKREASLGAGAGDRGMRRPRSRGRPPARATHRAAPRQARSAAQGLLYAQADAGRDGQALLEDARGERENAALLDAIRGERVGTLVKFIGYLVENGVMGGPPETFGARHAMQKYSYLAGGMGAPIEYRFDFLENGAYSAVLAADLYTLELADGGAPAFRDANAGAALVRLVRGRGRLALQAMTFAMRDMRAGLGRDEFVEGIERGHGQYSRRLLGWAFDAVLEATGGHETGR